MCNFRFFVLFLFSSTRARALQSNSNDFRFLQYLPSSSPPPKIIAPRIQFYCSAFSICRTRTKSKCRKGSKCAPNQEKVFFFFFFILHGTHHTTDKYAANVVGGSVFAIEFFPFFFSFLQIRTLHAWLNAVLNAQQTPCGTLSKCRDTVNCRQHDDDNVEPHLV